MRGLGAAREEADGAKAVAEVIAAAAKAMVARERVMIAIYVEGEIEWNDTMVVMVGKEFDVIEQFTSEEDRACCCEACACDVCVSCPYLKDLCNLPGFCKFGVKIGAGF